MDDTLGAAIEELIFDDVLLVGSGLFLTGISAALFLLLRRVWRKNV